MRRYLISIISATAVVASFVPSQAAGYEFKYGAMRGITASVKLSGGGTATAWMTRFDNVEFSASGTARPNPAQDLSYFGCITVKTSVGTDTSCDILRGAAVSLDPTMSTVTAAWTVDSGKTPNQSPPFRIIAVLTFTGVGVPELISQPSVTPNGTAVLLKDGPAIGRDGTVTGYVKSEGEINGKKIGGGSVTSTTSSTSWIGAGGSVHIHHP
jgi:hypothetical protein